MRDWITMIIRLLLMSKTQVVNTLVERHSDLSYCVAQLVDECCMSNQHARKGTLQLKREGIGMNGMDVGKVGPFQVLLASCTWFLGLYQG